ncbi:MAG: TIGR02099 family protein [Gammaproteobacteria bacterium]|nr:MAG: TIGR02099 family protein [Gammaproteobacteria bacterium]
MNGKRVLRFLTRRLLMLAALSVIAIAVLVSLGRETIGSLNNYRSEINYFASEKLGLQVESQQMLGDWRRLKPRITALNLSIRSPGASEPAIQLERITLEVDLLRSVLARQLVWRELWIGGVRLSLQEDASGGWSISNLSIPEKQPEKDYGALLKMLFDSDLLGVDKITADLNFYSGTEASLEGRDILLENSGNFHRLMAGLSLTGHEQAASLIVEAEGNPANLEKLKAAGYLSINRVDLSGSFSALAKSWFPDLVERVGDIETDIEGDIWIDLTKGGKAELVGRISAAEIPLNWLEDVPPVRQFKTDITGWFDPGESWGLRLQELDFDWGDVAIEPLTVNYEQKVGALWGKGSIALSQVNLSLVDDLMMQTGLASPKLEQILMDLQPSGALRSVHLDLDLDGENPQVELRANLNDVAIQSWRGAPGARHLNGYVETLNASGLLELDSPEGLALYYPKVFDDYMEHSSFRGQLRWLWDVDNHLLKIASGRIDMGGEEGDGNAHLYLDIPIGRPELKPEMYLMVGVRDTHSSSRHRYLPKTLNPGLLDWLDSALGEISVPEVGFVWRGPLVGSERGERSIQLYVRVADGSLQFQPDWPPLEHLSSAMTLDNGELNVNIYGGTLGNTRVKSGEVLLRPSPGETGQLLYVKADVVADAGEAVAVLAQSPLRSRVAGVANWDISGPTKIDLDLRIPLSRDGTEGAYAVDVDLSDAYLGLPDTDINFTQLRGRLSYRDDKGLYASGLQGQFWDEPVEADIATGKDSLKVSGRGQLDMRALSDFIKLDSKRILQGKTNVDARLNVPLLDSKTPIHLQVNSQLQGATIDLPVPFAKAASAPRDIQVDVSISDYQDIQITAEGGVSAHLQLRSGSLRRSLLAVYSEDAELPGEGQFRITGEMEHFSLTEWTPYFAELVGEKTSPDHALKILFDGRIASLEVAGLELTGAVASGRYLNGDWQVVLVSNEAAGQALVPTDTARPIRLDLEKLGLPSPPEDGSGEQDVDPASFPLMEASIQDFSVGDSHFGYARFRSEPTPHGVLFSGIDANLKGLRLGSKDVDTTLLWERQAGVHYSQFSGLLQAGDVGDVMEAWGTPAALESKDAHFFADLGWPGKPWEIKPSQLNGAMSLQVEKGRFFKSPAGAANAMLRLISLFNFDNWLRRLSLDFSDLFEKGMSFDEMQGGLVFNAGNMSFDPPLVVKMPSGRFKMNGTANLVREDIDAILVTTLPVGTNLPWVAALVGGLPAAAGVYITGKIFEKQVDKLSSISYHITGPWDDPEVDVERIFSDGGTDKK